jgi:hypothetical protein
MLHVHRPYRFVFALLAFALLASACSSGDGSTEGLVAGGDRPQVMVQPDLDANALNINVSLTDEGIEPDIIFIPAGRPIRLVLANHGSTEHHFRIKGLIPSQLRWMEAPEIDEYDIDSMTPDDLIAYGIEEAAGITDEAELAHYFHHLLPQYVPSKAASPAGIKPLGTEVHGYVILGKREAMEFIALQTGEYTADDVRFPEHTARVIVFDASGSGF